MGRDNYSYKKYQKELTKKKKQEEKNRRKLERKNQQVQEQPGQASGGDAFGVSGV